jgi:ribosomal protein L40E
MPWAVINWRGIAVVAVICHSAASTSVSTTGHHPFLSMKPAPQLRAAPLLPLFKTEPTKSQRPAIRLATPVPVLLHDNRYSALCEPPPGSPVGKGRTRHLSASVAGAPPAQIWGRLTHSQNGAVRRATLLISPPPFNQLAPSLGSVLLHQRRLPWRDAARAHGLAPGAGGVGAGGRRAPDIGGQAVFRPPRLVSTPVSAAAAARAPGDHSVSCVDHARPHATTAARAAARLGSAAGGVGTDRNGVDLRRGHEYEVCFKCHSDNAGDSTACRECATPQHRLAFDPGNPRHPAGDAAARMRERSFVPIH